MKLKSSFLTLLLLIGVSAFAIPKGPCDPKPGCCKEPNDPYAFLYPEDNGLECPRGFTFNAEFLWMKASEDNIDFAVYIPNGRNIQTVGFSTDSRQWDWRPGFRVGFGYDHSLDQWSLGGKWTYISIKDKAEVHDNGTPLFFPSLYDALGLISGLYNRAKAKWSGDYNTFDFNVGKPVHLSRYYVLHPFFGIRASWIDRDLDVEYSRIADGAIASIQHKNDFTCLGLRAGMDAKLFIAKSFTVFGHLSGSLNYGKFDITNFGNNNTPVAAALNLNLENDFYATRPNYDIGIGLAYSRFFNRYLYKVSFNVGYNFIYWWNLHNYHSPLTQQPLSYTTINGDLAFNGLSAGFNIDF